MSATRNATTVCQLEPANFSDRNNVLLRLSMKDVHCISVCVDEWRRRGAETKIGCWKFIGTSARGFRQFSRLLRDQQLVHLLTRDRGRLTRWFVVGSRLVETRNAKYNEESEHGKTNARIRSTWQSVYFYLLDSLGREQARKSGLKD